MTIVEITGGMLRTARSLTGLSQQELADRASSVRTTCICSAQCRPRPSFTAREQQLKKYEVITKATVKSQQAKLAR